MLLKQNVPAADISITDDEVSSTYEESLATRNWTGTNATKSLIIVTDFFHTRRVRWLFRKRFKGTSVQVLVRASPMLEYTPDNWWQNEHGVIGFQNEVLKYLYYRLKY